MKKIHFKNYIILSLMVFISALASTDTYANVYELTPMSYTAVDSDGYVTVAEARSRVRQAARDVEQHASSMDETSLSLELFYAGTLDNLLEEYADVESSLVEAKKQLLLKSEDFQFNVNVERIIVKYQDLLTQ